MKTLLIVEDEKVIRQGIRAMVQRSGVPVETILECRNGAEALEVLQSRPVDAMITDIRMPRMDGIELVRRAAALPAPPLTAVISGYDDFSYAVDSMRQGVRDYLVKPVEREQLYEVLRRMERELSRDSKSRHNRILTGHHLLRALMLGGVPGEDEGRALAEEYGDILPAAPYVLLCVRPGAGAAALPGCLYELTGVEGHDILLLREDSLADSAPAALCAGISGAHTGLGQVRLAFDEAVAARREAFLRGRPVAWHEAEARAPHSREDGEAELEQVVQLLGAGNATAAKQALGQMLLLAQNGRMSAEAYAAAIAALAAKAAKNYQTLPDDPVAPYAAVWQYESAYAHYEALGAWIERFCGRAARDQGSEHRRKIQRATRYLQENYLTDLNMTVVSNFVSMNYTQFSHLFKLYNGRSFLEYLKMLRLEEGKRLLRDTDLRVRDISEKAGFKNEKHFMKAFKQSCGVSPSDYRRNSRSREV